MADTDHQMPSLKKPIRPFFNPSSPPDEEHSNDALLTLAMFSFVMFTLPIGIFYFVRDYLITNQYDEIYTIVGPVLAAMITVNIIIVIYVYRAYQNFGRGRIITRAGFKGDEKPSFYRVLFAQPLMDQKNEEGRVIVEKVRNGVKYTEPVDLSKIAPLPDFILIPKDLEDSFCKWSEIRDYSSEKDVVKEPKYYTMPPLLKLYMEREMKMRGAENTEESFLLPHYKTYQKKNADVLDKDKIETYQETVTRCEGTAQYRYSDAVSKEFEFGVGSEDGNKQVVDKLPEEMPFPTPFVGIRLYKIPWSNMDKRNREDPRPPPQD